MEKLHNIVELIDQLESKIPNFEVDRASVEADWLKEQQVYKGLGIKILSIIGGLLASGFFLAFMFIGVIHSAIVMIVFGAIILVASIIIDKKVKNTVLDAMCVGIYVTACILICAGLGDIFNNEPRVFSIVLFVIALGTIWATKSYMYNLFSVLIIAGAIINLILFSGYKIYTIHFLTAYATISFVFFFFYEAKAYADKKFLNPRFHAISTGAMLAFLTLMFYFAMPLFWKSSFVNPIYSSIIIIVAILFSIYKILQFNGIKSNTWLIYGLCILVLAPLVFSPAICGAILMLLLSFHVGNKTGLALGVIAFIYFMGQFYYDLHFTLLEKSISMIVAGLVLLLAWIIFKKQIKSHGQV